MVSRSRHHLGASPLAPSLQTRASVFSLGATPASSPATCNVVGCSRVTWNGKINKQCCRTFKASNGACHGPECENGAEDKAKRKQEKEAAKQQAAAEAKAKAEAEANGHQHSKQTADFSLYHATSLEVVLRIQAEGFRVRQGPSQHQVGTLLGP